MKLDIGSGPREYWISEDSDWIHLDREAYEGVVQWEWPKDKLPVGNNEVDEIWIGQLFVELEREWLKPLAMEVDRVCRKGARLRVHCYDEKQRWMEFFGWLEMNGWVCKKEELVNEWDEGQTWLIEMVKGGEGICV